MRRCTTITIATVLLFALGTGCSGEPDTDGAADAENGASDGTSDAADDGGGGDDTGAADTLVGSDGRTLADGRSCGGNGQKCCESDPQCNGGLTCCEGVPANGTCLAGTCPVSDRNRKARITSVDRERVLRQLADLPIYRWSYRARKPGRRHLGPMAQEFRTAFGVGGRRYLNVVDANGVTMAAIQALYRRLQKLERRNRRLRRRVRTLERSTE